MNIQNFDHNLLPVLEVLLEERNVSRASERLGLSQPAVSNALQRLRDHFKDPLLVRSPKGMEPTPRALALERSLKLALREIREGVLEGDSFAPGVSERQFVIAATDFSELILLPKLAAALLKEAPKVTLLVRNLHRRVPKQELADGTVDMALGFFVDSPAGLFQQKLFEEKWMTIACKQHPVIREKLSVKDFARFPHVLTAPWGESLAGLVDGELEKLKLKRQVSIGVPHFLIPPMLVAETEYLATLPERVARAFEKMLPISVFPCPVTIPKVPCNLIWHERNHEDGAHRWLRALIQKVTKRI